MAKLARDEILMVNIGSTSTGGKVRPRSGCAGEGLCRYRRYLLRPPPPQVLATKGDLAKIQLTHPVCTKEGEKIALSRRVEKHWR